jgi:D-amino peptidase
MNNSDRPLRVMIWGDMEGVACIASWDQVSGGSVLYEECRALYTEEMNAAVRGAKRAGASEIICVDNHGAGGGYSFKSMIPERLESGSRWVLGAYWSNYVAPLREGMDAVVLVGAHARAGTPDGILSHTISSVSWYNASVNGVYVGESGIIAALAGVWNVPVVFVSGDTATCQEVSDLVGEALVTAPVKTGLGRFATVSMTPVDARTLIEQEVGRALTEHRWPAPYRPDGPVEFRVELATVDQADVFRGRQGIEHLDSRTIVSRGETFWEAWDQVYSSMSVGRQG